MNEDARRHERIPVLQMCVVGVIASALGIAAGIAIEWFPEDGSTQARTVDTVWDVLIWASVPVFVLVTVIVLFCVWKFRMRPGEENLDGPPIHGNTRLEVVWTAVPAILLVALCSYSYVELLKIEEAKANEMRINVTGQQFTWSFEYPKSGGGGEPVKSNELVLPVDQPVRFYVRSPDVVHDFWVPAFRMKIDAVPGIETHYRITPHRLGTYPVVCAELCGLGHALMRNNARVVTRAQFNRWVAEQSAPAQKSAKRPPDAKELFVSGNGSAQACGACHVLEDAATTGRTGPSLDKVLEGQSAAAIRKSIVDPAADLSPGFANVMPKNYDDTLSEEELDALVKYLSETVK